jgi:ABC-type branched-subunit amino acid transport system substrate-binding protein
VATLALVASACGDDDESGDDATDTAEATAPAETEPEATTTEPAGTTAPEETTAPSATEPSTEATEAPADPGEVDPGIDVDNKVVTVGAWRLASGAFASQNETSQAVEAALLAANEAGGINGWTFEYTADDTGGDPTRALAEVRRLVENDEVFALIWGPGSPSNQPVLPYLQENPEVPYIPGMSADPFKEQFYENIFPTIPPYSDMAMLLAKYAIEDLGAQKIALVYQDDAVGQDVQKAMGAYVESIGGELVAEVPFAGADTDFTPVGQRIAEAQPDAVVQWGYPAPLVQAKAATMAQGVDVPWFGPYFSADDAVVGLDPAAMDGAYFNYYLTPVFETEDPEIVAFREAMTTNFPDATGGGLALNGYAAGQVFLAAFEEITADGQVPTREALMDAWESWDTKQVGVVPAITYNGEQHRGPTQSYIIQWVDGGWQIVSEPLDHPTGPES